MLDNTQSIICAFGLTAAAPRSPYRHLELCGIAQSRNHQVRKSGRTSATTPNTANSTPPILVFRI
ncbi:MAG: hypothetical protein WAZ45_05895 [Gemmiger qucibialis]